MGYSIALVVGAFNKQLTDQMVAAALQRAKERNVSVVRVVEVPGSFDMPLAIKMLLKEKSVDGVVLLGAIVKGETMHDEVIAHALASQSARLSCEFEKPVMYLVSGPGQTREMAERRAEKYGKRGIDSIVHMLSVLKT